MKFQKAFLFFFSSFFLPMVLLAQEVPMINDDPKVSQTMNNEMFDFVAQLLGSGKMSSNMKCTLKVRHSRELRHFSTGQQWIETLDLSFNSNGFESGLKFNFKVPMNAKYGLKKITNQWSGVAEEIKIELGDYYDHWIKFSHDGQGRLIGLVLGNNLRIAPCEMR